MYSKVTKYELKPGVREDAVAAMNEMKQEIMAMPGMISFINVIGKDRKGLIVIVATSRAVWDANAAKAAHMWSKYAAYLVSIPTHADHEVLAEWHIER